MPDRSDIEQALASIVADALYPQGTSVDSAIGTVCKIYRGWPVAGVLESDLERGVVHISVLSTSGTMRDRTRYSADWQGGCPTPTMNGSVRGEVVTFSGSGGAGQVAGIRVDGRSYAYRMRDGDSTGLVAAALAALIRADRPALALDSSVQLLSGNGILARVVSDGEGGRELRRQRIGVRATFWCPDPVTRDNTVSFVDVALASQTFIDVGGWACRLQLGGDNSSDDEAAGGLWRRDLIYTVEYPTVTAEALPAMLFGITDVNSVAYVG